MGQTESLYKPLAWSIVFVASMWLVISGSQHQHDDTMIVLMGIGLFTGLIAILNINGRSWIGPPETPEPKDMTPP